MVGRRGTTALARLPGRRGVPTDKRATSKPACRRILRDPRDFPGAQEQFKKGRDRCCESDSQLPGFEPTYPAAPPQTTPKSPFRAAPQAALCLRSGASHGASHLGIRAAWGRNKGRRRAARSEAPVASCMAQVATDVAPRRHVATHAVGRETHDPWKAPRGRSRTHCLARVSNELRLDCCPHRRLRAYASC